MRFRIPPQHKETVTIVRKSAYESTDEETIAEDVVCLLSPETDGRARQDAVRVSAGVPIGQSDWTALLEKPNPDIAKGDFLKRADGTEFRVQGVLWMKGTPVMQLQLKHARSVIAMVDINFDAVLRVEIFIRNIGERLQDYSRFWRDYVAPFTYSEIDDIFDSEGHGSWAPLDPIYAARKAMDFPGQGILRREDTYFDAATHPNHPGSIAEYSPTELVLGVSGSTVEHAAFHEEGTENLSARPVYELIAAGRTVCRTDWAVG